MVGDDHHGHLQAPVDVDQQAFDAPQRDRIETRERLVAEEDDRLHDDGPGERDALHHAARELARQEVVDVGQPDGLQPVVHLVGDLRFAACRVCSRSGKARLSKTVIEFDRAPPWNIIPSFAPHVVHLALGERE